MAIDYIRPLRGRSAFFGPITNWKATRKWLVHTTTRYDEEWPILQTAWLADSLPKPFSSVLGTQPLLLCKGIGGDQVEKSPQHWVFKAEYDSQPLSQQRKEEQQYPNPLDRPFKITWNTAKYNKPAVFDTSGNLILNSAGEPYDPPAEKDASHWVANVTKNLPGVPSYVLTMENAINSTGFTIQTIPVDQYCAKVMSLNIGEFQTTQVGEDIVTWLVFSYSIEFRNETWKLQPLDQGYRQIDPNDSTKRIHIKDDAIPAKFVTKPWPLDGSGAKLANPSPSNAVKRSHNIYTAMDLGNLLPGLNT